MTPLSSCDALSVVVGCTQTEKMAEIAREHGRSLEDFENELSQARKYIAGVFSGSGLSGIASAGCYYGGAAFNITASLGYSAALGGISSLWLFYRAVWFIRETTNASIQNNSLARNRLIHRSFRID